MTDTMKPLKLKENVNPTQIYKSIHPGRLLPTASTFGPLPNYGGEAFCLPLIHEHKKGCFASGKLTFDPVEKKKILGLLKRTSTIE